MPVNRIWVLAESFEGKPLTISLELLTAARTLGSTVEAVVWGADGDAVAAELGKYGATKGGDAPDAILIPTTYDGRDIAGRLSVKLDKPVLTNIVGLAEAGGKLV